MNIEQQQEQRRKERLERYKAKLYKKRQEIHQKQQEKNKKWYEKKHYCKTCADTRGRLKREMSRLYIRDKVRDYLRYDYGSLKDYARADKINEVASKYKKRAFNAIGWYCKECKTVEIDNLIPKEHHDLPPQKKKKQTKEQHYTDETTRCEICNKLVRTHGTFDLAGPMIGDKSIGIAIPNILPNGEPDLQDPLKNNWYLCHKCHDKILPHYDNNGKWISRPFQETYRLVEQAIKERKATKKMKQ